MTASIPPQASLPIDSTGIPHLDDILGGGLPRRALVIIVGAPGSGKTTLATQMAFAAARDGRQTLIFTAISESTEKLITHVRTFDFCQDDMIGSSIKFLSLQSMLENGLGTLSNDLVAIARQSKAKFVVIDGFRGIRGIESDLQAARQFLYDIGAKLGSLGITIIITSEAEPRDPAFFPEATTADIIIGIHYNLVDVRHRRMLEAVKVRGSALLGGLHYLAIESNGINIYPRLESRLNQPVLSSTSEMSDQRINFGLPELDALLEGGIPSRTNTLIIGSLGTGKTLLALHHVAMRLANDEPTVFVSFREDAGQLLRLTDNFGIGPKIRSALTEDGLLQFRYFPAVEVNADKVAEIILSTIDHYNARYLVIDGITELMHTMLRDGTSQRVNDYFNALVYLLHQRQVSSLFISEHQKVITHTIDLSVDPISILAENLLLLQQVTFDHQLRRMLSVVKMRYSTHDTTLREFLITSPQGIKVLNATQSNTDALQRFGQG